MGRARTFADYVLYRDGLPPEIVEARDNNRGLGDEMQQASWRNS